MKPNPSQSLRPIRSVSEINAEIRHVLESDFRFVRIRGEVSTIRKPYSGHYYFILKDESAQLNAVLFKNQQRWLSRDLADGQEIICDGRIAVYEPRGQYQLIVDTVDFDGTGQLQVLFEQLKLRLRTEGLFAAETKLELPEAINRIAVITSPTGAAIHDFLAICRKRNARSLIQILPVRVQGSEAAGEICAAIETAHHLVPDVIVICRGGGSIEDLWAFNEEAVARAIHRATIPVVTGIGHETDFTIADFCADIRCPTPTGAAELLIVDPRNRIDRIAHLRERMIRNLQVKLDSYRARLDTSTRLLATFDDAFSGHTFKLDHLSARLQRAMSAALDVESARCSELRSRLSRASPEQVIATYQDRLDQHFDRMTIRCRQLHDAKRSRFLRFAAILDTLSPLKTMARGYSVVTSREKPAAKAAIITDSRQVQVDDAVDIRLHRGNLACRVTGRTDKD